MGVVFAPVVLRPVFFPTGVGEQLRFRSDIRPAGLESSGLSSHKVWVGATPVSGSLLCTRSVVSRGVPRLGSIAVS